MEIEGLEVKECLSCVYSCDEKVSGFSTGRIACTKLQSFPDCDFVHFSRDWSSAMKQDALDLLSAGWGLPGFRGVYPKLTEDQILAEVACRRCGG
jgi:hypothetical protein